ncbi:MAG: MmcQ/YjbR family DNA-binding protein [Clostridia bacterium]|nr:MmcQ/YjbR family DNA-binding protein [Clostridia bacterium]
MEKRAFLTYCAEEYGTLPDYPFEGDPETAVLRHKDNRKWYALVMRVSRRKFGFDSDEVVDVLNLKLPTEMFGSFGTADGVHPAYHMNKVHWISVLLADAQKDLVEFLVDVSYEATLDKKRRKDSGKK